MGSGGGLSVSRAEVYTRTVLNRKNNAHMSQRISFVLTELTTQPAQTPTLAVKSPVNILNNARAAPAAPAVSAASATEPHHVCHIDSEHLVSLSPPELPRRRNFFALCIGCSVCCWYLVSTLLATLYLLSLAERVPVRFLVKNVSALDV